jgi:hypothetical protein
MLERRRAAPAEADYPVPWERCREMNPVLPDRRELPVDVVRIERADDLARVGPSRVRMDLRLAGEKVWGDGDEAISCELVGDAADPACEPEDLVDDHDDRRPLTALRVHDPGAHAVIAGPNHDPLGVAWRVGETLHGVSGARR